SRAEPQRGRGVVSRTHADDAGGADALLGELGALASPRAGLHDAREHRRMSEGELEQLAIVTPRRRVPVAGAARVGAVGGELLQARPVDTLVLRSVAA